MFLAVPPWGAGGGVHATAFHWTDPGDVAEHLTKHWTTPRNKALPGSESQQCRRHREQMCGCQVGGDRGRDRLEFGVSR